MRRRALALTLGLLVGGAPEALALCHVACAASIADVTAASHHVHPSSHVSAADDAPQSAGTASTGSHLCGHPDELPAAAFPIVQLTAPAAILTTIFNAAPRLPGSEQASYAIQMPPPDDGRFAIPLRI